MNFKHNFNKALNLIDYAYRLDAFKNVLNIGDRVIIINSNGGKPYKGVIKGFTPKSVKVKYDEYIGTNIKASEYLIKYND